MALQFLTTIPVPGPPAFGSERLGSSLPWFPLVGLVLGGLLALEDLVLSPLFAAPLRSALELASLAMLTGALHLDGFADTCDGIFCRKSPEERLQVMRDSRIGSFGVVGLVCLLLTKWAALAALAGGVRAGALVLAPTAARWAMAFSVCAFPAVGGRLGQSFKQGTSWGQLVPATLIAVAAALALGPAGLVTLAAAWLSAVALSAYVCLKISGMTGDTYGAVNETVEAVALVVLAGIPGAWRL